MPSETNTVDEYIEQLPEDRKEALTELRRVIHENLPKGFAEIMSYGMPGYVVPHTIYPAGYHCDPKLPLPFMGMASQKNYISFYHMGLYANAGLLEWFLDEYPRHSASRLDMGKSCVRFKKSDNIPFQLIGELVSKMSVQDWITNYESQCERKKTDT